MTGLGGTQIVFDPYLGWGVLAVMATLAALITVLSLWRGLAGWWLRALGLAAVLAALANPALLTEDRDPLDDIVLILRDDTGSNRLADRAAQSDDAVAHLRARLSDMGVDHRVVPVPDGLDDSGTRLMAAMDDALADLPRDRLAGVVAVSDGIVHDVEAAPALPAPLHLLQTGDDDDWDRRLIVRNAPAYGILGEPVTMTLRIEDEGAVPQDLRDEPVRVGFSLNGEEMRYATAPVGRDMELDLTLERGGPNVLHFVVDPAADELTARNNEAVVQINGIRDRLRVLLVSGEPHTGQRTWRNLLKSDPAVDLVHFTILRPPDRQDGVPVNELSLIAFPTRELFVEKIDEFDLIVFDRYRRRGILPNAYFENIRSYVESGGAMLISGGDELAGANSIFHSPLGRIFPAEPTGRVFDEAYRPRLSETGTRHPVTADLAEGQGDGTDDAPGWGRWLRQIELIAQSGVTVMDGIDGRPLLVLDRVGEGRIALLASDQAWLWDRGFEGGGPQAELLRRLAHWMMGEPDLEEEALRAEAQGMALRIVRRSLEEGPHVVTIEDPQGARHERELQERSPGRFAATFEGDEPGLYRLRDGDLDAVAVLGPTNPREFATTIANPDVLNPAIAPTQGGTVRVAHGLPDLRTVASGRQAAGRGWLGIVPRGAYVTTDLRLGAALPPWAWLLLGAGLILAGWLREARR
ncbi:MAG: putative membrane protein [Rhodobacteraceae bacterium HLUCCA12]|nr:MAG: putative membrane protein [Rhodobacteraceae bacterium HLUCCA12]